jgi:hypothetical protein
VVGNRFAGIIIFVFVLGVAAFCAVHDDLPAPVNATAPFTQFSVERAFNSFSHFATAPHPIGSREHDFARNFLYMALVGFGLGPEVQKTTGVTPRYQAAGTIENIVCRRKGTSGAADAVAFVAHYDSVAAGPGAGDDGAGVVTLLEIARRLQMGPPLRNDVILLFTDGEEDGLLGASAFVAEHPWAKDVRVVVNFEARGNAGPSQMFETSAGNGRLVEMFAEAAPYPDASSLTYEIYQHMPNDTDMTVFKKAGDAGLNFAFIGHWEAYHTPLDSPVYLDRRTVQQQGDNAMRLLSWFGNVDLTRLEGSDAVYFSLPENFFVHYPESFIWPFTIAAGVLLFAVTFYAKGAWQTRLTGVILSIFLHVVFLVVAMLVGLGFVLGARWLHLHVLPEGPMDQNVLYTLGLFTLLLAVLSALYHVARKKISAAGLLLGGTLVIFGGLVLLAKWLPGGSYILLWPLVAALLAMFVATARSERGSIFGVIILCLLSVPAIALFVPLLRGFYEALGFTEIGAPLLAGTFGVLFLLLFPFLDPILESFRRWFPIGALAVAAVLCVIAGIETRYSAEHPKPSLLTYALDADTGKAVWASTAARVDEWTAKYVTDAPTRSKLPDFAPDWYPNEFLVHEAAVIPLAAPQAVLVENTTDSGTRTLRLRITSPRNARTMHVGVSDATVLSASVNGRDLGKPWEARWHTAGRWGFDYANIGDGIDLQIQVRGTQPITVVLVDRVSGIPMTGSFNPPGRPAESMPIHSGDQIMVRRSFTF